MYVYARLKVPTPIKDTYRHSNSCPSQADTSFITRSLPNVRPADISRPNIYLPAEGPHSRHMLYVSTSARVIMTTRAMTRAVTRPRHGRQHEHRSDRHADRWVTSAGWSYCRERVSIATGAADASRWPILSSGSAAALAVCISAFFVDLSVFWSMPGRAASRNERLVNGVLRRSMRVFSWREVVKDSLSTKCAGASSALPSSHRPGLSCRPSPRLVVLSACQ